MGAGRRAATSRRPRDRYRAHVNDAGTPDERTVLHHIHPPLTAAMRDLLARATPITVDRRGRETFERTYLPRLQAIAPVSSPDGSFAVPAPPRAALELRVHQASSRRTSTISTVLSTERDLDGETGGQ